MSNRESIINKPIIISDTFVGYSDLLRHIRHRISIAQSRAIYAANEELLRMYWDIGELLEKSQIVYNWSLDKGLSDYELGQALPTDYRSSLPTIEENELTSK